MHTPTEPAYRPFVWAMLLGSVLAVFLLGFRIYYTGSLNFLFLIWNLFLAWLPLGFAWLAREGLLKQGRICWSGWAGLSAWLLFFPNAPYIATDFVHFRYRSMAPWWFDLGLLICFSATGLLLGLASLLLAHEGVRSRTGVRTGWIFVLISTLLAGFGIYLGRFLRWNSWDVVSNPLGLANDIADRLLHPTSHPAAYGVTAVFGALVLVLYLGLYALAARKPAAAAP